MVTLEQVRLLETKVTKTIEYVKKLTGENTSLKDENASLKGEISSLKGEVTSLKDENATLKGENVSLKGENTSLLAKLETFQRRIDELEALVKRFQEDQSRIENGILSALDRLNQFEDVLESTLLGESKASKEPKKAEQPKPAPEGKPEASKKNVPEKTVSQPAEKEPEEAPVKAAASNELDIF
ncbi:MAG: cell division protein ZapB [Treponema sp.]|jgi:FtsZ-binding cell division protein ZapB|nr:cell division protein ZapB [Treponema sp.]